jgi:hypothetical protein
MIFEGLELYYVKCTPKYPNAKFDPAKPVWETQIRTRDRELKKKLEDADIRVTNVIPDDPKEPPYFKAMLRKSVTKKDGTPASPVEVVNGANEPVDPATIGNGSIANVRVFQYPFPKKGGGEGRATVLMGIQVTKHIVYKRTSRREEFGTTETEVIDNTETAQSQQLDDRY